jgi:DNA-binding HxlR family transcriptional regulator
LVVTRTAEQRRAEAREEYNAFLAACPSRQLLDALSNKWVCLVLSALEPGPLRYGDLRRAIAGISQKMLTQTLRALERDGLVTRHATLSVPVRVDYALSPLGESLTLVLGAVKRWAEANMDQVLAARRSYDGT